MNLKIFSKIILTTLLAFFAAGGACYETPKIVTSDEMVAADVFTFYRIEESIKSETGKCVRRVAARFSGENREYRLQPPARATLNGREISGEFGCETDKLEFVLTDRQGGARSDVYELKKAEIEVPQRIDRSRDLRISIKFDDRFYYNFSGTIQTNQPGAAIFFRFLPAADEADLAGRLNDPAMAKDAAYFLPKDKLLVIPKHLFSPLASGDLPFSVGVEQRLFKPKSKNSDGSLKSAAFSCEYKLEAKPELK